MAAIDDLIFDARFFAAQIVNGAGTTLQSAMSAVNGIGIAGLPSDIPDLGAIAPPVPPDVPKLPVYSGAHFEPAEFTASVPSLVSPGSFVEPAGIGEVPSVRPYQAQVKPSGQPGDLTLIQHPPNLDIDAIIATIPVAPDLQAEIALIEKPTISAVNLPTAPVLVLPEFVSTNPTDPGAPPANLDALLRDQYETISPIMRQTLRTEFDGWVDHYFPTLRTGLATMEAKLDTFIEGGTGFSGTVEDAMYNRALDKIGAESVRARDTAYGEAAKIGMTIAAPLALQQAKEIDQGMRDNLARAATDIYVENAKLEQTNIQFALTLRNNAANTHLTAGLQYHGQLVQINGQAVQYAIAVVEQVVKVYNLRIEYARVQVALEESRARVYEAKLKGALAVIDFYKAQIEGELAKVNVDQARVAVYRARLEAVQAEAAVYNSQIQGARLRGDIEKLRVELFGENVKAFGAQVSGYVAQWQGYEAATRGEMTAVQASVEQIRGYTSKAETNRAVIGARSAAIEARQRQNDGNVRLYDAQVGVYRSLNSASAESVRAEIESFDLTLRTVLAEQNVRSDFYRSQVSYYDTARRALIETINVLLEEFRAQNQLGATKATAIANLAAAIGHDYAATAQSALSGLNTLAGKLETTSS